jgi:hypothetical protein
MSSNVAINVQKPSPAPLDAATQNWKDRTKNCKRTRVIQAVALAALVLLTVALLAMCIAMPYVIPFMAATLYLTAVFVPFAGILCCGSLSVFIMRLDKKKDHYEKPEVAQEIVNGLRYDDSLEKYCGVWSRVNVEKLAKYGFIKDDKQIKNEFKKLLQRYKEIPFDVSPRVIAEHKHPIVETLMADWKAFRDANIIPHLPNPK